MELFVALGMNAQFCAALQQMQSEVDQILTRERNLSALVSPHDYHLTLRYLGAAADEKQIIHQLNTIVFDTFSLKTDGIGAFQDSHSNVVWVGVQGQTESLRSLQAKVDAVLENFDIAKNVYDFSPHITLAYFKHPTDMDLNLVKNVPAQMDVDSFGLYEIVSTHQREKFRKIHSFSALCAEATDNDNNSNSVY